MRSGIVGRGILVAPPAALRDSQAPLSDRRGGRRPYVRSVVANIDGNRWRTNIRRFPVFALVEKAARVVVSHPVTAVAPGAGPGINASGPGG
jgi:hypothetical protein